jgi:glutamine synthetase type III
MRLRLTSLSLRLFFEETNLAVDKLFINVMQKVERHDLKVLLHEKPFKGKRFRKHNNWSLDGYRGEL